MRYSGGTAGVEIRTYEFLCPCLLLICEDLLQQSLDPALNCIRLFILCVAAACQGELARMLLDVARLGVVVPKLEDFWPGRCSVSAGAVGAGRHD